MNSSDADSLIYFGKSSYQYYSKDNICIANTIIFDNKTNRIAFGKYIITKTTSRNDLKQIFPLDCNETKPINVSGEKEKLERCSIPVKDMRIIFFFKNDKLVRIDFWEPD
jgi:hypothetical protein